MSKTPSVLQEMEMEMEMSAEIVSGLRGARVTWIGEYPLERGYQNKDGSGSTGRTSSPLLSPSDQRMVGCSGIKRIFSTFSLALAA